VDEAIEAGRKGSRLVRCSTPTPSCRGCADAALAGQFDLIIGTILLDGLRRMLTYPKLQAVIGQASQLVKLVTFAAIVVQTTETIDVVRDPDDDCLSKPSDWRRRRHR
jgi:predicted nucleic acid-binding protein